MPRYRYSVQPYPVFPQQRRVRWPWALLVVIIAALGGVGALLIAGDRLDSSRTDNTASTTGNPAAQERDNQDRDTGQLAIISPDEATQTSQTQSAVQGDARVDAAEATGTASAADSSGAEPDDQEVNPRGTGEAVDASDGSSAAPATPTLTPTPAGPSPADLAREWATLWTAAQYGELYDLLSTDAQEAITREDFVERYQAISERAALTTVSMDVTGEADLEGNVPVTVSYASRLVGDFQEENRLSFVLDENGWAVAWTTALIFRDLGNDGCVDIATEPTERGMIFARDGEVLAQDDLIAEIGVVPGEITDESQLLRELARLLDLEEDDIEASYADAESEWFIPVKLLPESEVTPMINDLAALDGVRVQTIVGRTYPYGSTTAHITGYVSRVTAEDIEADPTLAEGMWIGRTGLEAGADDLLAGRPGAALEVVECETRALRSVVAERAAVPGKDVFLTIDMDLQDTVDKVLTGIEGDDERASAVILDPQTGAVLAMASHPSYDPNGFILGFSEDDWEDVIDAERSSLLNRASEGVYPTGSIFKVITTAAAMEYLDYDASTQVECPATYELNGNIYRDWIIEWGVPPQGTLTLHDALVQSCNTVYYDIGAKLDTQDPMHLPEMTRSFGLGQATGIPYLPESGGTVPDPAWKAEVFDDGWATGDAINLSVGQGYLLATPLQMANAYATIANGGTLLEPFIVEFAQEPGGPAQRIGERTEVGQLPLDQNQIGQIQAALRDQTSNAQERGSARVFGPAYPFAIAGKTGTAENLGNRSEKPHSWFAAFGPYDAAGGPTIASVVMAEEIGEGGQFAAPATKAIYDAYVSLDIAGDTRDALPPESDDGVITATRPEDD